MKRLKRILLLLATCVLIVSCFPGEPDCEGGSEIVENLISITPIQSRFRVNDTLTLACTVPAQNTYFGDFDLNIFRETGNAQAVWTLINGSQLLRNQELITRKGFFDAGFFIAVYDAACDCYEFEADLVLNEFGSYTVSTSNNIFFNDLSGCDDYFIETTFPWVNQPNLLEFEVVP